MGSSRRQNRAGFTERTRLALLEDDLDSMDKLIEDLDRRIEQLNTWRIRVMSWVAVGGALGALLGGAVVDLFARLVGGH